jgi:hypothetical protein
MAAFSIDRILMKVPGLSASQGQGLARDIADGLSGLSSLPGAAREIAVLDVRLRGAAGESRDALALRVAAEIVRRLDRTR